MCGEVLQIVNEILSHELLTYSNEDYINVYLCFRNVLESIISCIVLTQIQTCDMNANTRKLILFLSI